MTKKITIRRPLSLKFWKPSGENYRADREELYMAIKASGRKDDEIKVRMGAAFPYIQDLLAGRSIDYYVASFVDWGLTPDSHLSEDNRDSHTGYLGIGN